MVGYTMQDACRSLPAWDGRGCASKTRQMHPDKADNPARHVAGAKTANDTQVLDATAVSG
jgi:hypothetical protein